MARVSTKENKNVYHLAREEHGYSREKAAELTGLEPFKIERIENEKIGFGRKVATRIRNY